MNEDLRDVYDGLDYCRRRSNEINETVFKFAREHIRMWQTGHPTGHAYLFARIDADIPKDFGRDLSGLINETRAQLDHLANILGRRNGANADNSSFPIVTDGQNWNRNARNKIMALSTNDQNIIEGFQPFNNTSTYPLSLIHLANNFHKHREPLAFSPEPTITIKECSYNIHFAGRLADTIHPINTDVCYYHFSGSDVTLQPNAALVFTNIDGLEGRNVFRTIREGVEAVTKVVDAFNN